jgi:hypothetical protein
MRGTVSIPPIRTSTASGKTKRTPQGREKINLYYQKLQV